MPESFVNVTEGSGKKLHTWQRTIGANDVHDEFVVLGEQPLSTYDVATIVNATVSTATANSHLLQIMAGASLKLRIRRIEVWQSVMATTVAIGDLRLARLSTAGTGGTAIAVTGRDPSNPAAGGTAMTLPTVKGTEAAFHGSAAPYFMQTLAASSQLRGPMVVWDFDGLRRQPIVIPAGAANGLAIKCVAAIAGAQVFINVTFDEANF